MAFLHWGFYSIFLTYLEDKSYLGGERDMLQYAILFLVIAIIAAIFGFGGIAGTSAWIAQVLFIIFLVLFAVSLIRKV